MTSKRREELRQKVLSFIAWVLINVLAFTSRLRVVGYERVEELVQKDQGFIMAVWHGRTLMPIHYCRGMGIWAITSLSRDGEIQTRIVNRFGYKTIRGSTARGGIKAALAASKKLENGGILAITPDGPKGPPNEVQDGVVFLSQRAQCPIIPIGVGVRPGKKASSWDSYMIPMPFSRCALVFGEPIFPTEDAEATQSLGATLKAALDDVQSQAELMVKEGQ